MKRLLRQLGLASSWPIISAVILLCAMGIISIRARSPDSAAKQFFFALIGLALMLAMQLVNYQRLGRYAAVIYFAALALIVYTILPMVPQSGIFGVPNHRGQRNWINFGFLNLQPAELMKVGFCMVLARYLRFRSNYRTLPGLIFPFLIALFPLTLILRQPDLGTALVFIPTLFIVLFAAGAKMKHLCAIASIALVLAPVAWFAGPESDGPGLPVLRHLPTLVQKYQRARVIAMFSDDPAILKAAGFQQSQSQIAFGSGAVSGRGTLNIPAGARVPEAHNDMIFAIVGEQWGFIGAVLLIGTYLVIFIAGIEIAAGTHEPFGRLLAVGIVAILAVQAFMNLMVTLKLMPVTGVTLPFVSYGGSSLLVCFLAVGLLINIGQNRPIVLARDSFEFDE